MSISLLFIISVIFSVSGLPSCFSANQLYEKCLSPMICGSESVFPNITYPFWGDDVDKPDYCGQSPFKLSCEENQTLTIEIDDLTLRVVSTNLENNTFTVTDESLSEGGCPKILNFTGNNHFTLNHNTEKIDLFDCPRGHQNGSLSTISCHLRNDSPKTTYHVFGPSSIPGQGCEKIGEIPMLVSAKNHLHQSNDSNQAFMKALEQGFELRYSIENQICHACTSSRGICGSESESQSFRCLCEDKPHKSSCDDDQG